MMIYEEGDDVRIRTWDDMEEEYGLVKSGHETYIDVPRYFNKLMDEVASTHQRLAVIDKIMRDVDGTWYKLSFGDNSSLTHGGNLMFWSAEMFEQPKKNQKLNQVKDAPIRDDIDEFNEEIV